MKKTLFFCLCLFVFISQTFAQQNLIVIDTSANGKIKFARLKQDENKTSKQDSKIFLKNVLKVPNGTEFYLYKLIKDELGMQHEKYQVTFKGIKVEFSEFIIHRDQAGNIITINGDFTEIPSSLNILPKITYDDAIQKFANKDKLKKYRVLNLELEKKC